MLRRDALPAVLLVLSSLLVTPTAIAEPSTGPTIAPASQQTFARVIRRFGAAMRESSEASSPAIYRAVCNDVFLVVGDNGPWRQVFMVVGLPDEQTEDEDNDLFGWMRDEHLAVGPGPASVDCQTAAGYSVGGGVESWTDLGCLSLRTVPDGSGVQSECRPDGVVYQVVTGPLFSANEDWYELQPPGGARGWAPGALILPTP